MILEKGRKAKFSLKCKRQNEHKISAAFLQTAKMLNAKFVIIGLTHVSGGPNNSGNQESQWKVSWANKNPFLKTHGRYPLQPVQKSMRGKKKTLKKILFLFWLSYFVFLSLQL